MPYAVPDGGIIEIILEGRLLGQQVMSVLHFRLDQAGGITDGKAAADSALLAIDAGGELHELYMDCISQDYNQAVLHAQWILPQRFAYVSLGPTKTQGTVAFPAMGSNLAVCITKRTDFAGPHSHGTLHMPGVPTVFSDDGFLLAAGRAAYEAFARAMGWAVEWWELGTDRDIPGPGRRPFVLAFRTVRELMGQEVRPAERVNRPTPTVDHWAEWLKARAARKKGKRRR